VDTGPVDFAVTGNAGDDEELPGSARPPSPRRRLRADIAVGIVVLGGAYLIARALSHGNSTHPAPSPSPTATRHVTVPLTGPPPRGVFTFGPSTGIVPETLISAQACPRGAGGRSECTTTHALPAPFVAAVHRAFPQVVVDSAVTTVLHSDVWSRTVSAHDRNTFLVLVVSRNGPPGTLAQFGVASGENTFYVRAQQAPYTVQLEAVELSGVGPRLAMITALANDPRLVRRG
jgi:hypothetical protein